ncbi:alpha/beta fold hydrolase [Hymenobacter cellulosilyticus]|uniref:Alpha/beta hydrolase n=1 Tax=Hymenobacter cellulosilyticus TaxID=2932248 RepID=A0A8T9Q192_9BACT|nr:alpha/beta hydrolase [Hymenobacter cellulosilyticus]UOQ70191.1 alpha/beta hydrolase [Hymenobacter cellulosilyticus]
MADGLLQRHHVRILGQGQPLVLCNGFGCTQQIWRHLLPGLSARYQLVLFDYVSVDEAGQPYATLAEYAHDVVAICRALELPSIWVLAHSVGASIAMLTAIAAPELVERLILLTPSPYYFNEGDYYGGFEREDVEQLLRQMTTDYGAWSHLFAGLLLGPLQPAALGEELAEVFCQNDPAQVQHFAQVSFFTDSRKDVPVCGPARWWCNVIRTWLLHRK